VWEKDEVRKDDSFRSFEEVFEIAARNNADFVLLGGDLFHDNKPSRATVVRAMDILTRHCMGDRPVRFQVLSDQAANFTTGRVNYEDPNYNVALPVLTIHGNHDDPAGAENLSAVDILSTCRLVNYFGKAAIEGSGVGKLRIAPVLLQKGSTQVALYGLGNLRDERLCRLFQTPQCVEWARPADTPEIPKDDWFNIFVLHQNRVAHTQNAKNCLREGALAKFLDLVVW
jgi:double-strand break repair protein MRE11